MVYICQNCKDCKDLEAHNAALMRCACAPNEYEARPKVKVCPGCGHVTGERTRLCEVCGADQTANMWCATCKVELPYTEFYKRHDHDGRKVKDRFRPWCRTCERERKKKRDKFNRGDLHDIFAEALIRDIVESLPTEPLTEEAWLKTCRYFKGCAICGANDIQIRHPFIPRSKGGSYTLGNVIPLCGKCSAGFSLRSPINPLYLRQIQANKLCMNNLDKIYDFIKGKKYEQF